MNVVSVHLGPDPAGISGSIARAFRNEAGWSVRSFVSRESFLRYPMTEPFSRKALGRAWRAANVLHLHNGYASHDWLVARGFDARPAVVHYHGSTFRKKHKARLAELRQRGGVGVVSTLDLYLLSGLEWLPAPINVEELARVKKLSDKVVIAHAPTDRSIKSTAEFLEAFQRLQDEGYPVELELIERAPWAECLSRKARADIFFDQVLLGYGNNALEAWAMKIPVIAGAADETLDEMERRFGHLPFYPATVETIYDALKELVESPELRQKAGQIGYDYVRKYHDEPVVVEQLKRLYGQALGDIEEAA